LTSEGGQRAEVDALAAVRKRPDRVALLFDVDGTLAPIVAVPTEAAVPPATRELLRGLAAAYRLVACISGRRAVDARALVGLSSIEYVGNHGLERLPPGADRPEPSPAVPDLAEHERAVRGFAQEAMTPALRDLGIRLEDKRSIWSFHWRGAVDEKTARVALEGVAKEAASQGLVPHWGRKVLEIRPPVPVDKGTAVEAALAATAVEMALYAGDDVTDLDAFRRLRALEREGALAHAVCVGVRSSEGPTGIVGEADVVVEGPEGLVPLLESLLPTKA
jgi:trehalose 6-phosphate phosphatase